MSNHKGSKLTHVAAIVDKAKTYTSGVAECGHSFTRTGRLSLGQRIFCFETHPQWRAWTPVR